MIQIPSHIRGLVFDVDGTIADTMPLHYQAWVQALGEHGVEFPEALFYEFAGIPTSRIIELLNERHGAHMPVLETYHRKENLYLEMIPQVKPIEPVIQIIHDYHGKLPIAVATGGTRAIASKTLAAMGVLDRFEGLMSCADDVQHGKPAPDVFLLAAKLINVDPTLCMAFEDADLGIQSAVAAGMTAVDVRHWPRTIEVIEPR